MFVSCLNLFELSNFKPKKSWCFRSSSVSSRCSQETKRLWPHKMVLYNGNINAKSKYKLTMNEVDQLPRSFFWVAYITYINDSMPWLIWRRIPLFKWPQRSTLKGWDWHSYLCSPVLSAGTPNKTWEIEWRIRNARQWSRKQTSFKYIVKVITKYSFNYSNRSWYNIIYIAVCTITKTHIAAHTSSPKIPPRYTDFAPQPTQPRSHIRNILLQSCTDHLNPLHLWVFLVDQTCGTWCTWLQWSASKSQSKMGDMTLAKLCKTHKFAHQVKSRHHLSSNDL